MFALGATLAFAGSVGAVSIPAHADGNADSLLKSSSSSSSSSTSSSSSQAVSSSSSTVASSSSAPDTTTANSSSTTTSNSTITNTGYSDTLTPILLTGSGIAVLLGAVGIAVDRRK